MKSRMFVLLIAILTISMFIAGNVDAQRGGSGTRGSGTKGSDTKMVETKGAGTDDAKKCCVTCKVGGKPQTTCPVMGGKIDKKHFADVRGKRIYVCCPGCIEKIKKDPVKYIKKIRENGETPETRLVVCSKCGELKGCPRCCAKDAVKCDKCERSKGSIGCCKGLKAADGKDVVLCAKCGQVKGAPECCKADAPKCDK
ncbi:hypothetical protein ACFL1X_14625, partial [Candidatus Hydrogenedentota bacterium]